MAKDCYVGLVIADIHAGAMESDRLFHELDEEFIKYVKSMKLIDFIVIAGDLFDTKLSLNSEHVRGIFAFLKELADVCVKKNIKLRIIKGTESHDNKQLDVLKFLSNSNLDIKIFDKVCDEELFPGMNVLYIPEEYIPSKDEYYETYLRSGKEYDMVFGHGLMNEVAFVAKMQESEITMNRAPIFKSEELLNVCKGPIFFGHIHKPQVIKDRIFYTGSFSRWCFGEEEAKGFRSVVYTPETGKFKTEFIENKLAKTYNTMVIDYRSSFYKDDDGKRMNYILSLVNNSKSDKLRIIFNIPEDYPEPRLLIDMINETFMNYRDVKVVINNGSKEAMKKKEMNDKIKGLMDQYGFIFEKGVSVDEKISKFIKIKYNKDIDVAKMRKYLYEVINGTVLKD